MENSMEIPQKTEKGTTIWFSNSTPRFTSSKNRNTNSNWYMHLNVHSSTAYHIEDLEAIQVSINRQIYKEDMVYRQCDIIQSLKIIKICHLKQWTWT